MTSQISNYSQLSKNNKISANDSFDSSNINMNLIQISLSFILIGDINVGKTSIANRFCNKEFEQNYQPTIEINFKKYDLRLTNETIANIQIFDTMGQEKFKSLTKNFYRNSNGIFLVFDLTDLNSFNNLNDWLKEINNNIDKEKIVLLVGNKSDDVENRKIEKNEIENFSEKFGIKYIEVSAKNGNNIDLLFETMSWDCYNKNQEKLENQFFNNNNNNNFSYKSKNSVDINKNNKNNKNKNKNNKNTNSKFNKNNNDNNENNNDNNNENNNDKNNDNNINKENQQTFYITKKEENEDKKIKKKKCCL